MAMRVLRWTSRAALAAALASAPRAEAGLGEHVDAIAGDRKALAAQSRGNVQHEGYAVERLESAGSDIREFVSPSGIVFAVAWDGVSHPDLSTLLASYAPEYRKAAAAKRSTATGRRRRLVRTDRVVVETWGHMRSLHGRAYVPALIPPGVRLDAIR